MTRRCSHCGHNGHNSRTCPERGVKLFGVHLADNGVRKSVSMGNLNNFAGSGMALPSTPEHSDNGATPHDGYISDGSAPSSRERKKGIPWTEEEHRMFLLGLHKLGKGDWRGISRNFVQTRTPTQVASHAQKYFIRQNNLNKRKRRSSLFDIGTDGVTNGMGRSMSTPSLPTLSEDSSSLLHSQSSGSQNSMYSPPASYDLNRSQSYPSALPGTGIPQPAGPTYGAPSMRSGPAGPLGMLMPHRTGSSGSLDVLVERMSTSGRPGMEHSMSGVYESHRSMGVRGLGMGYAMGLGYGTGMRVGGQQSDVRMEGSAGPPLGKEIWIKNQQEGKEIGIWKEKSENTKQNAEDCKGFLNLTSYNSDPALSHRMGHEMMMSMTSQAGQWMGYGGAGGPIDTGIDIGGDAAMEDRDAGAGEKDREDCAAADRNWFFQPGYGQGWFCGQDTSSWASLARGVYGRGMDGEDPANPSKSPDRRLQPAGPSWPGSYPWGPQPYGRLGYFAGPGGPSPYSPYSHYPWGSFGSRGPPPYGTPPGMSTGPLNMVSACPTPTFPLEAEPMPFKVLRPTASLRTCPLNFDEKGSGNSPVSGGKSLLGSSSPSEPSPLTARLLERSSSHQSAFQSRSSYGGNDMPPGQTEVGQPMVSVV